MVKQIYSKVKGKEENKRESEKNWFNFVSYKVLYLLKRTYQRP